VEAVARGESIGHLFDRDEPRLRRTAARLGIKRVKVERIGTDRQHVDLCGGPLRRAVEDARCRELREQATGASPVQRGLPPGGPEAQ
jgi:hypothetical protein